MAYIEFNADAAVVGDLVLVDDGGVGLPTGVDVSVRNLSGAGVLEGNVSVRGAVQPGPVPGWMAVYGSVTLEPGAAFQPEVQGPDSLGMLYVRDVLDLTEGTDAIGPSWVPGSDASSMFGGTYVVADSLETIEGEFDVLGGGNIGAAYIAGVEYDVVSDYGDHSIKVTLHDQLAGDVDLDGTVESGDYLALKRHIASTAGAVWGNGDFDFDGDVDRLDFLALRGAFGETVGSPAAAPAPEPTTVLLLGLGASALLGRRRRQLRRRR